MKFAKRLESEAVAEWRPKYLQYKQLKKLIKASLSVQERQPRAADVENASALTEEEQVFCDTFDSELVKIDEFYKAREKEAVDRKYKIMAQLHLLPEDEPGKKKKKRKGEVSPQSMQEHPGSVATWRSFPGLEKRGGELSAGSGDEGQMSILSNKGANGEVPEHVKISSLRPTSYTDLARLRIKKALLEYYRLLELIRNFKSLNVLGCAKILKKFEKNTGKKISAQYLEKLRGYSFYSSTVLDDLMSNVENIYRFVFTDGDRAKALRKLRIKDLKRETFHSSAWISGVFLGICLTIVYQLINLVVASESVSTRNLGIIYFGLGLPFLMAWLFAVNAQVWDAYYVNYRFIFEFNQRNNLHVSQYSALVGIFALYYLVLVAISLNGHLDAMLQPVMQPWAILTMLLLFLVVPFNAAYRQSRLWFARVILRIATAPFYPCRFKDFFINDQYMSFVGAFEVLGMLIFYTLNSDKMDTTVAFTGVWYVFALQLLPGTWRSLQCLRRYHDSKMAFPHLANLAKYFCGLAVTIFACIEALYMKETPSFFYVVVAARIVSSFFSLGWDIVMDFGLWQRSTVNDRLRNTILFRPWIYWYLIISDTIARFLWVLPILRPKAFPFVQALALKLVLWTIEALRRFQWNFFRVEYEHVNNCNVFRAVADVPLPFTATDLFYQDMVETIEQQRVTEPCAVPASPGDELSPCSSIAGDLDDEEYALTMTRPEAMEMVEKTTTMTNMMEELSSEALDDESPAIPKSA